MKTLLIDSPFLCHRAMYATENSNQSKFSGVIYGFLRQVQYLAQEFHTKHFIFCWDSWYSKRREIYPDYKKNRNSRKKDKKDSADRKIYHQQFSKLRMEILPLLGFNNNFMQEGYEADDLIASIASHYERDFLIISGDNDLWQLLDFADIFSMKGDIFTYEQFCRKWQILPGQWMNVKALAGCNCDNIKGIKRVGNKTACSYLNKRISTKSKIFKKIMAQEKKIMKANMPLVKLPMKGTKVFQLYKDNFKQDTFNSFCQEYHFHDLEGSFLI